MTIYLSIAHGTTNISRNYSPYLSITYWYIVGTKVLYYYTKVIPTTSLYYSLCIPEHTKTMVQNITTSIHVNLDQISPISALGTHFAYIHYEHTECIFIALLYGKLPHKC